MSKNKNRGNTSNTGNTSGVDSDDGPVSMKSGKSNIGGTYGKGTSGGSSGTNSYASKSASGTQTGFQDSETESRQGGRGNIQRGNRPSGKGQELNNTSNRDPSNRKTGKPDVTMGGSSETVILRTCASILNETIAYALEQGGEFVEGDLLKCAIDTQELVTLYANFVARQSDQVEALKPIVADAVKCAEENFEVYSDDETFTAAADVCRECCEHLGVETQGSGEEE